LFVTFPAGFGMPVFASFDIDMEQLYLHVYPPNARTNAKRQNCFYAFMLLWISFLVLYAKASASRRIQPIPKFF